MSDYGKQFFAQYEEAIRNNKFDQLPQLTGANLDDEDKKILQQKQLEFQKRYEKMRRAAEKEKDPNGPNKQALRTMADKGYPSAQSHMALLEEHTGNPEGAKKYHEKIKNNEFADDAQKKLADVGIETANKLGEAHIPPLTGRTKEEGQHLDSLCMRYMDELVKKDPHNAEYIYRVGADRGYPGAQMKYAELMGEKGDKKTARTYAKMAKNNEFASPAQLMEMKRPDSEFGRALARTGTKGLLKASGLLAKAGILYLSAPYVCGVLAMTAAADMVFAGARGQGNFAITQTAWNLGKSAFSMASSVTDGVVRGGTWLADQAFKRRGGGR